MRIVRHGLAYFLACLLLLAAFAPVQAGQPTYWLVQAPALRVTKHGATPFYPGYGVGVAAQPYAYGWFGHGAPAHWHHSYGISGRYRQWELR